MTFLCPLLETPPGQQWWWAPSAPRDAWHFPGREGPPADSSPRRQPDSCALGGPEGGGELGGSRPSQGDAPRGSEPRDQDTGGSSRRQPSPGRACSPSLGQAPEFLEVLSLLPAEWPGWLRIGVAQRSQNAALQPPPVADKPHEQGLLCLGCTGNV